MAEKDPVKKGPKTLPFTADMSLLSDEDKKALTKEVEAAIADERKKKASDAFFDAEVERLRRKHIPAASYVRIVIDSAPYVPHFMIDGQVFMNGYEYEVPLPQALVLQEMMQRSWLHQDEIDGRSRFSAYRRERREIIGAQHAGTATRGFAPGKVVTVDSLTENSAI